MARNRVIYIGAALGCLIFSMAYKEKISAVLLAAVIIYPVLAFLMTLASQRLISAEFAEKYITAEKNTRFELSINIKNRFIMPCVPAELFCALPDEDTGLVCDKRVYVTLPPFGSAKITSGCMNRYRGKYAFEIKKISVVDPLRIIRLTKKCGDSVTAVFLPRKLLLGDIAPLCKSEQSAARKQNLTSEKDDFSHVRDYIPGDAVQLVHWKLTAKQNDLMIKQFDSINDRKALIMCDFGSCQNESDALLCADTVIETALAFAKAFSEDNIFTLADFGQSDGRDAYRISNQKEFEEFYDLLSVIPAKIDVCDFRLLAESAGRGESVLVLITTAPTQEIVAAANALACNTAVFLAYINMSGDNNPDLTDERFYFLNIKGAGQEALDYAFEDMQK